MLESGRGLLPAAFEDLAGELVPAPNPSTSTAVTPLGQVDVVFPLLHGPYGEDGTVQGLLELAGLPYVGSGVLGSAIGMDKYAMKRMMEAASIPVAGYWPLHEGESLDSIDVTYPCFVKPANMGSSVGISKVRNRAELEPRSALAFEYDEWLLVEDFVPGREIEVAVLGDRGIDVSVPGEVVPGAEFYDYADKYENGTAQLLVPAPLDSDQVGQRATTRGVDLRRVPLRGHGARRHVPA